MLCHVFCGPRSENHGGKKRRKKNPLCHFLRDICSVETLVCEYLWREENLFSFRHFRTNKILPLTGANSFRCSLQDYDKATEWIWTQIGGGMRNDPRKRSALFHFGACLDRIAVKDIEQSWKSALDCRVICRMKPGMRNQRCFRWLRWDDLSWIKTRLSQKIRTFRWQSSAGIISKKTTRDETEAKSYLAVYPEAAEHIWL